MKLKKKIISGISIVLILGVASGTGYYFSAPYFRTIYSGKIWTNLPVSKEEDKLLNFVDNSLVNSDGGIYTNYINEESEGDITKGHAVLSESQGLMLLYSLESDDKERFDKTLSYVKNNMLLKNNLLSWRVSEDDKSLTSATIDDLRVVKSLLLANEKWGDFEYRKLAVKISKGINKNLVDKDVLTDFEDGYNKGDTTTLCYLDLPTLRMLSNIDYNSWKKVYDKSNAILNGGYISDTLPLYRKTYYRNSDTYDTDENADTLLSMTVILNKLEEGQDVKTSVEWIRKEFQQTGVIVTSYNCETGLASSNVESTSIYALIMQISNKIGDREIEKFASDKLKAYQVKNPNSEVYGGYGTEDGSSVFSYDNLNALLAYRNYKDDALN